MASIAKELDNRKHGDRRQCPICNTKQDRIPLWKVWAWSLIHPDESPFIKKSEKSSKST